MRRVILESPYAGDVEKNILYARECMEDSLRRGEAPLLSHLLYTQVLDDKKPEERKKGIQAGLAWIIQADCVVLYEDLGISSGMAAARLYASSIDVPVEYRKIRVL